VVGRVGVWLLDIIARKAWMNEKRLYLSRELKEVGRASPLEFWERSLLARE
jgi:hypothetical protein